MEMTYCHGCPADDANNDEEKEPSQPRHVPPHFPGNHRHYVMILAGLTRGDKRLASQTTATIPTNNVRMLDNW
jgi:hypothetical protein